MKAAVYYAAGDIRVEEVREPKVTPGGIVIKVKFCGVCGSDLHTYRIGKSVADGPSAILGHEFSGDVCVVGSDVTGIRVGDRVTAHSILPCGKCASCMSGQPRRCPNRAIMGDWYALPGAFAEYVHIPWAVVDETVYQLPDEFSYQDGALIEPLAASASAVRRAEPRAEDAVVVLGAGVIGNFAMQTFKAMGVGKVIVTDVRNRRLKVAKATGADFVVNAAHEDPVRTVREITAGAGADIVADCAGTPATFRQCIDMVRGSYRENFDTERPNGKIAWVANYEKPVTWNPNDVSFNGVRMMGSLPSDFLTPMDLVKTGKVNVRAVISHELPLSDIIEAFELQANPTKSIKVLVKI